MIEVLGLMAVVLVFVGPAIIAASIFRSAKYAINNRLAKRIK